MTTHNEIPAERYNLAKSIIHSILWTALIVAPGFLGALATLRTIQNATSGILLRLTKLEFRS
jgi:hypothetical protein